MCFTTDPSLRKWCCAHYWYNHATLLPIRALLRCSLLTRLVYRLTNTFHNTLFKIQQYTAILKIISKLQNVYIRKITVRVSSNLTDINGKYFGLNINSRNVVFWMLTVLGDAECYCSGCFPIFCCVYHAWWGGGDDAVKRVYQALQMTGCLSPGRIHSLWSLLPRCGLTLSHKRDPEYIFSSGGISR